MGIDAQLKDESGDVVAQVGDGKMTLSRAARSGLGETRLLKYLMPYGDTVFNQAQADDLRNDIQLLIGQHPGTPLVDHLSTLQPLVEQPSTEIHLYLWFIGD